MIHFLSRSARRLSGAARRHPISSALAIVVVLAGGWVGGTYTAAVRQWHRAEADIREGRPAEARTRLEVCLKFWPRSAEVHQRAARAARMTGDFAAAEDHLNMCLRIEGEASEATQLEFLLMRAQTGEIEEVAGLLFSRVDQGHRDSRLILETIVLTYMHNLRYGPAFAALKRWAELLPDDARVYHYLGWVLERLNQPAGARENYLRALTLDPGLDPVRLRVAEMYLEDHDATEAAPHVDLLLSTAPDRPEVLALVGQCRFVQGRHAEARHLLERAVEHRPDDPRILLFLGRLDIEDREPMRAERRLRRALAADPSDTEIRYTLVAALRFQERDADAAAELAEYERHKALLARANQLLQDEARHPSSSRDPTAATTIGALLLKIGQDRQGLYWLDEALSRDPQYAPAHQALADYFTEKGDAERAAAHRRPPS